MRDDCIPSGEIYEIVQDGARVKIETPIDGNLYDWYDRLPHVFTQNDLLELYGGITDFQYILKEEYENHIIGQIKTEVKQSPKFIFPPKHQAKELYEEYTTILNALRQSNQLLTHDEFIDKTGFSTSAIIRQIMVELEVDDDGYFDLILDAIDDGIEFGEINFDSVEDGE